MFISKKLCEDKILQIVSEKNRIICEGSVNDTIICLNILHSENSKR